MALLLFTSAGAQNTVKPLGVALVIGDQWTDPISYMVEVKAIEGAFSGNEREPEVYYPADLYHLVILLKSWGIPFDIYRLDQQFLDINMFIGPDDLPKYGTIVWAVNESDRLLHPDYAILEHILNNYETGFIATGNRISQPVVQSLLGLEYEGEWRKDQTDMQIASPTHYIAHGLSSPLNPDGSRDVKRIHVRVKDAEVIATHGELPMVTARQLPSGSRLVWFGGDPDKMFAYQGIRTMFRNAMAWTSGWLLYKTWENTAVMWIDDFGSAQNAWLEHWHYPALTEEEIVTHLVEPLKEHGAVLNINMCAGFVNEEKRRTEPSFTQVFTDAFGTRHDYVSTKRGLDRGLAEGVFSMQCHGLTHMQPDLSSPPTWYGADLYKEKAEVGWYREFGDIRRQKEIPAAEQMFLMKTAQEWTVYQFGVFPLAFNSGGPGASVATYRNNTYRIAGRAGFGWSSGYVGPDLVVRGWAFYGTQEAPHNLSAPPDRHDRGIVHNPEGFLQIFEDYPDVRFMSANELVGYLHAENSGRLDVGKKSLQARLHHDEHYCAHFRDHPGRWKLEFADWAVKKTGTRAKLSVDGKASEIRISAGGSVYVEIPPGTGTHTLNINFNP